jgi:hypothetical protein
VPSHSLRIGGVEISWGGDFVEVGSTLHCGRARKSPRVADFVIDGTHAVLIFVLLGVVPSQETILYLNTRYGLLHI